MPLSDSTRLGPYKILAPLGAGGMGEVYRATDTRLKRQVALKILPAALADDPDRLARFQREAEVLASLNHPHIATIYGLEDAPATGSGQAAVKALVMELVEGPTLADRITQGPIPIDEALPIARQIADALEAAHEQGIVHRDLKPANIKVREDGTVKVLDFGLAKLTESRDGRRAGRDDSSQSPTLTSAAAMTHLRQGHGVAGTEVGVILGTAAYMSPEQARGRAVDKRTDVWAFGAVLYEMLTGVRAFAGDDITDVIAEVVKTTPDWMSLPADVPPQVVTLIQRCLEKDRNARIGDIAVARFLLSDHATVSASRVAAAHVPIAAAARWRLMIPWVLAAVVAGTLVGWFLPRRAADAPPMTHLQMSVQPAEQLAGSSRGFPRPARTEMAVSPDGRLVVFAATRGATTQLQVRALDRSEATPLQGTDGASGPFFSPDGTWIGFWAGNTIKKLPAAGGTPTVIAEVLARAGSGTSWAEDGIIFFESNAEGISSVPSSGGTPAMVTTPDAAKGERHLLPVALPGGKALLFTSWTSGDWNTANVVLRSFATGEQRVVIPGATDARYVSTGHLLYMKAGTLMAVPFDVRSEQLTGAPVAVIAGVMQAVNTPNSDDETGAGQFAVSTSGTLLYVPGGVSPMRKSSPVWVNRSGAVQPLDALPPGPYLSPRLSPDGQKIAMAVRRDASRNADVWVYEIARGAPTRVTFEGGGFPLWSPDGKRLVYGSRLHVTGADGSGKPAPLAPSGDLQFPSSWAPAANMIAFVQQPRGGSNGIWVLPMDDTSKPRLFLESRFDLWHPELSPDGQWMAYVSNESGTPEVYVQPYPGPGEKVRISTAWALDPIWTANGRELLYRSFTADTQQFFSVAIRSRSPFQADRPRLLFDVKNGTYDATTPDRSWDISADGQRLLLLRVVESTDKPVTVMHVVLNWAEELKRLVPAK